MATRITTWPSIDGTVGDIISGAALLAADDGAYKGIRLDKIGAVAWGQIVVTTFAGQKRYQCVADGTADDRAQMLAALTEAAANMPCSVEFGAGNYGISGGIEIKPPQGAKGLRVVGHEYATRVGFNGASPLTSGQFIAFKVIPSVLPSPADTLSEYVQGISFEGITFFDDDPALHGGTEESHAISVQYAIGVNIEKCHAEDIGDEAFNYTFVRRGKIDGCNTVNVPSVGAGGGAITVQHGSSDIAISNCNMWGSSTPGVISTVAGGYGINLEQTAGFAFDIEDIAITNCNARDFGSAGINFTAAVAGAEQRNITITGGNLKNCDVGIKKNSTNDLRDLTLIGITISDMDSYGIRFPGSADETFDLVISDNVIEGCAAGGMELNLTSAQLSNNQFKNCPRGIYIFNGSGINIASGSFDSCGGSVLEEIEDITPGGGDAKVANVTITNSNATSASIKGVPDVTNVKIGARSSATSPANCIFDAVRVRGCEIDGGIRLRTTAADCQIEGNKFGFDAGTGSTSSSRSALILEAGNDDAVITGNQIDMRSSTNNQRCVYIKSGADRALLVGNNLKSLTAGSTNAVFIDAGATGTKFDTTIANVTT